MGNSKISLISFLVGMTIFLPVGGWIILFSTGKQEVSAQEMRQFELKIKKTFAFNSPVYSLRNLLPDSAHEIRITVNKHRPKNILLTFFLTENEAQNFMATIQSKLDTYSVSEAFSSDHYKQLNGNDHTRFSQLTIFRVNNKIQIETF